MRRTTNEYNHDARKKSLRLTAARLQLAVGRRGLGPREQGEQRTQRVFRGYTYRARVHTEQHLSASARLFAARLESERRLGCFESRAEPSALGVAPDIAVVDVVLKSPSPKT